MLRVVHDALYSPENRRVEQRTEHQKDRQTPQRHASVIDSSVRAEGVPRTTRQIAAPIAAPGRRTFLYWL